MSAQIFIKLLHNSSTPHFLNCFERLLFVYVVWVQLSNVDLDPVTSLFLQESD
jgi:hypothetical protein